MSLKIAILGSPSSVLGFRPIGLAVFKLVNLERARKKILSIAQSNQYGILFITEDWAKKLYPEIDQLLSQSFPAIITIPSSKGASKEGMKNLKRIVEKAVGSDILNIG